MELSVADQEMARIVVRDNGQGIPRRPAQALRSIFPRAPSGAGAKRKGLVLDSAIVKDLVELHGGTIAVHSALNQGTAFTFTIPLHSRASSPAAICHLCAADYWWWMTILTFATSCGIVSNRKAFRSRVPSDGKTALRVLADTPVDGVLPGHRAPGTRWVRCSPSITA